MPVDDFMPVCDPPEKLRDLRDWTVIRAWARKIAKS